MFYYMCNSYMAKYVWNFVHNCQKLKDFYSKFVNFALICQFCAVLTLPSAKIITADAIDFIPYGTMVDEFQHIVYGNPELTPKERRDAWNRLEQEYRPYMDSTGCRFMEEGGYWQRQHHIFEMPFYYIDYVLAQLCAFQFKIRMEKDHDAAWADYMKLCRLSASDFYPSMLKQVGLTVPFTDGCIQKIVDELDKKLG